MRGAAAARHSQEHHEEDQAYLGECGRSCRVGTAACHGAHFAKLSQRLPSCNRVPDVSDSSGGTEQMLVICFNNCRNSSVVAGEGIVASEKRKFLRMLASATAGTRD